LEKKKEEVRYEKEVIQDQKRKEIAKLIGRALLKKKVENTFDKYEEKTDKKQGKL